MSKVKNPSQARSLCKRTVQRVHADQRVDHELEAAAKIIGSHAAITCHHAAMRHDQSALWPRSVFHRNATEAAYRARGRRLEIVRVSEQHEHSEHFVGQLLIALGRVEHYVANRISDPSDAADIVQESLTRVIERARTVEIARLDFYAMTIARNLMNDRFRAQWSAAAPLDEDVMCREPRADQILSDRERLAAFRAALAAMPPLRREVFVRRRLHGQSRTEIAEALNIAPEAVKKHVSRALAQLAQALENHEVGFNEVEA